MLTRVFSQIRSVATTTLPSKDIQMMFGLISGSLSGAVEHKISKKGTAFTSAKLKVPDGDVTHWVRVVTFSESVAAELAQLCIGDAVSVQGLLKVGVWVPPDGREPRVNMDLTADAIIPLRRKREKRDADDRRPSAPPPRERPTPRRDENGMRTFGDDADEFGDRVPF